MTGFVQDLESLTTGNEAFRHVLYTAKHCQLVLMAIPPDGEIGMEVHTLDQFFRVEVGVGAAVLDGVRTPIAAGFAVLVPAGTEHNIVNTGRDPMKLYICTRRRTTATVSSTPPAPPPRRTTSTSTARRPNTARLPPTVGRRPPTPTPGHPRR